MLKGLALPEHHQINYIKIDKTFDSISQEQDELFYTLHSISIIFITSYFSICRTTYECKYAEIKTKSVVTKH
jgi:hypothetical protein